MTTPEVVAIVLVGLYVSFMFTFIVSCAFAEAKEKSFVEARLNDPEIRTALLVAKEAQARVRELAIQLAKEARTTYSPLERWSQDTTADGWINEIVKHMIKKS